MRKHPRGNQVNFAPKQTFASRSHCAFIAPTIFSRHPFDKEINIATWAFHPAGARTEDPKPLGLVLPRDRVDFIPFRAYLIHHAHLENANIIPFLSDGYFAALQIARSGVERDVGPHAWLDAPDQFPGYGIPIGSSIPLQRQSAATSGHNSPNENMNIVRALLADFKRGFLKIEFLRAG